MKIVTSNYFNDKIKEMDVIAMEHGLSEDNQLTNWCKVFYAACLYSEKVEGESEQTFFMKPKMALDLLYKTTKDYQKNLDDEVAHPFLESFYQQVGNMAAKLSQVDMAAEMFESLLKCKESQYGHDSKEVIAPLMQV